MRTQNIVCPACGEQIEWDADARKVVSHGKKQKSIDLTDAVKSLKAQEAGRLEMFQRAKEEERTKSERLDKLFSKEEKRVREEKDFGKYIRDVDLD
ncbi:MAG: hypothetical protein HZA01_13655 [Nitrospinae bacterium]|nr:hypothetical protein [Nitrospinota bacterium]